MLQELIKKSLRGTAFTKARVIISIPSGVTAVERRAVKEAAEKAGARPVQLVQGPLAAALGAGLNVLEPTGNMVIDIGGGISEIAVMSLGGIVSSRTVRTAGNAFDTIVDVVEGLTKNAKTILDAARTSAGRANDLVGMMDSLKGSSDEISEETGSVSAATEELSASMDEIANASRNLAELAQKLQDSTTQFKL